MDQRLADLWRRIQSFSFDDGDVDHPFAARLARENRWSAEFTARVIEEYRRFVFLSVAAGHAVTPSKIVDEAWHLHLIYTRSYWERLCPLVLGRPLHHEPSRGGAQEEEKFREQYRKTLASYRRFFPAIHRRISGPRPIAPARQTASRVPQAPFVGRLHGPVDSLLPHC